LWSKLTEFYLLVGKTFDGLTVKGKGTGTLTNNNFVSGDLLAAGSGAGLAGDGSTKYLDTGLLPASNIHESGSIGFYRIDNTAPTVTETIMGARDGSIVSYEQLTALRYSSTIVQNISDTYGSYSGMKTISRRSASDLETYDNGVPLGTSATVASSSTNNNSYYIFCQHRLGTPTFYSAPTLTFVHIGTSLTDTDAANLSLRVNKLMYDLGCETYIDQGILDAMTLDADAQTYAEAVLSAGGNFEAI
jgi:hypothetical protein